MLFKKFSTGIIGLFIFSLCAENVYAQKNFCIKVPILMYHHIAPVSKEKGKGQGNLTVTPEFFESHLQYLQNKGYKTLKAEDVVDALITGKNLEKSVVITIDDGYEDIYNYAYPLLKKYNSIANIMVITGLIDNTGYLSWSQLKEMKSSGLVYMYNHTWSHPSLSRLSDQKIIFEVGIARDQLKDQLGIENKIIAYPYGSFNQRIIDILVQNGFVGGFSTIPGNIQCQSFIMKLHRRRVGNVSLSYYGI